MKIILLNLLSIIFLSSCATVKFYDDTKLTKESGIEFYSAKPYLLVERKPAKDIALKSTIIYLPDMGKPKYAKLKSGLGSSDLKLGLSNGIITSYGVISDSKIPETITAITGILGATEAAYKAIEKTNNIPETAAETTKELEKTRELQEFEKELPEPTFELYEIIIRKNSTELIQVKFPNK